MNASTVAPSSIACPTCSAPVGEDCDGRGAFHFGRQMKAAAYAVGNTADEPPSTGRAVRDVA